MPVRFEYRGKRTPLVARDPDGTLDVTSASLARRCFAKWRSRRLSRNSRSGAATGSATTCGQLRASVTASIRLVWDGSRSRAGFLPNRRVCSRRDGGASLLRARSLARWTFDGRGKSAGGRPPLTSRLCGDRCRRRRRRRRCAVRHRGCVTATYLLCGELQTYRLATYTIERVRHARIAETQSGELSVLRSAASITP